MLPLAALALSLLAAPTPAFAAATDTVRITEIPTRYELPNFAPASGELPESTNMTELHELLLSTTVAQTQVDAVPMLNSRLRIYEWDAMDQALFILENVYDQQSDPVWRRYVLAAVFPNLVANFRASVEFRPTTPGWPDRWTRLIRLRDRLAGDRDPKLRESMERFQNLKRGPGWKRVKRESAALQARMLAEHPELKETWEKAWELAQSVEDSQNAVADRLIEAGPRDKDLLKPEELQIVALAVRSTADHRNRSVWGNIYRRVVQETLERPDPKVKVLPVATGWADFKGLEGASGREKE